jgi:PAS domain S-box-containing protein
MQKILFIEDDTSLRETTCDFLVEEGFVVIVAGNGLSGIQKALQEKPSLILCDISLPEMNGYEVFKALQQHKQTSFTPFIFLTAKAEKEDIRMGMQLGADDYITKPFDLDELLTSIKVRLSKYEKVMKAESENYKQITDNALSGYVLMQENKVLYTNTFVLNLLASSAEELADSSFAQFIDDENKLIFEDKIRRCLKGLFSSFHLNVKLIAKDKKTHTVKLACSLISQNNNDLILCNIIPISTEIQAETGVLNLNNTENEYIAEVVQYLISHKEKLSHELSLKIVDEFTENTEKESRFKIDIKLTQRELEVLQLVCNGFTNSEIADKLFISQRTVDTHRANLLAKTGCENTAQLIVLAIKNKMVTL